MPENPSLALFMQLGAGYQPVATGIPHQRHGPFRGVPGLDSGLPALASMYFGPQVNRAFAGVGMTPFGVGHDQNIYDALMNQRFTQMQMQAMRTAAEADRQNMMRTMRGLAALTGTPFGIEQRRAAQSLTGAVVATAPLFAEIMPEVVDQLGGLRGSATVMARRMIDAGRYRMDPVTGRMGMSAETVGAVGQRLFTDLYADDVMHRMRGISAGQAGALFEQLQLRGMVSTAAAERGFAGVRGDDPRAQTLRALEDMHHGARADLQRAAKMADVDLSKGIRGLSANDLDKLSLDPGVSERLRGFDAERIKRTLKNYTGAISAMRDIFGDMGRPNAPMQELLQGLEALTGGSMAQLDPTRLGQMARQTYNLSKQTGVTLDNALLMQQHAAVRGGEMGLNPIFAAQATQGGLAFGGAYRAQGHAAFTSWNAMNADQLQQLDINLRQQAAASSRAQRHAVALRLQESGAIAPGTEAARYVEALKAGLSPTAMPDADFVRIMSASGRTTPDEIRTMLLQRGANQEQIFKRGVAGIVRREQAEDVFGYAGNQMGTALYQRLTGRGMAAADARRIAVDVGQAMIGRYRDLSTEEATSAGTRNRLLGETLETELRQRGHGAFLDRMSADERRQFLTQTAAFGYESTSSAVGQQFPAIRGLGNAHRAMNRATLDAADQQELQAKLSAQMQESLAPLGQGSVLSRAVTAIQQAQPGDDKALLKVVASALGGVKTEDINAALLPNFQDMRQRQQAIKALETQALRETDPRKRRELLAQLATAHRELQGQAANLAKIGEQFGFFAQETLTPDDVTRAVKSNEAVGRTQQSLAGLHADFATPITQAQRDAFMAAYPQLGAPTPDQMARFRKKRGLEQASEADVKNAMIDDMILGQRQGDQRSRFRRFWHSAHGAAAAEDIERMSQDVENTAHRLTTSPQMAQRLGTRAFEISENLQASNQRLRELAMQFSGNDLSRLFAGDFTIDLRTAEGRSRAAAVQKEVNDIQKKQRDTLGELQGTMGKPGRQFRADDQEEALKLLGHKQMPSWLPARAQVEQLAKDVGVAKRLTPEQDDAIHAYQELEKSIRAGGTTALGERGAELASARAKIEEIAKQQGVAVESLLGATGVTRRLYQMQREYAQAEVGDPKALAQGILKEYGFADDQNTTQQRQLTMALESTAGRGFGRRVLASMRNLKGISAKSGLTIDEISSQYDEAIKAKDKDKLAALQGKLSLSPEEFSQFERDIQLQERHGLLDVGPGKRYTREDDLLRRFNRSLQHSEYGGPTGEGGGPGGGSTRPTVIEGTLDVHFTNTGWQGEISGLGRQGVPV